MNSPYVFANGMASANDIKEPIFELIACCEFAAVAELAIQFVETVSDDELGQHLNNWQTHPEATV